MGIQPEPHPDPPAERPFTHDAPAHTHLRPTWLCRGCGEPWPCEPEQQQLLVELAEEPMALYVFMSICLDKAIDDLPDVPVGELWMRFLGWVRTADKSHPRRA